MGVGVSRGSFPKLLGNEGFLVFSRDLEIDPEVPTAVGEAAHSPLAVAGLRLPASPVVLDF